MIYRHDLLRWRRQQTGDSYATIAAKARISRMAVCDTVRGRNSRNDEVDPTGSTIKRTFKAMGLDPKYAFDDTLRKINFGDAVIEAAR